MKRLLKSCAVIAALSWPSLVHAERPSLIDDYEPGKQTNVLELETGWYFDDNGQDLHVLTPAARLKTALSEHAELEIDWPSVLTDVSGGPSDYTRFLSGNPLLAGYLVKPFEHEDARGYMRIGLGIAPPVIDVDPGTDLVRDITAFSAALATRGWWDAWSYAPDTLSVVVPAQWETLVGGALLIGGDAAAGLLFPTDDRIDDDTDLTLQAAGTLGYRSGPLTVGGKLQGVWLATTDGDNAQLAAVPFVQADVARGAGFVYSRFVLNLDEPLGVFGDGADVWGLYAGGGARF